MNAETVQQTDPSQVLAKATLRAAQALGLRGAELTAIIGRDRSSLSRSGIDPHSKSGELALLLIRCYRSLAVMVDSNAEQMQHWMQTDNNHTGGVPAEQLGSITGLVAVTGYLDAIRGRL
ncbi:MAG: antitoxin Xre/MbcA/ParS toxin-binding domain-containing protein [Pseudomonadales bacterium]